MKFYNHEFKTDQLNLSYEKCHLFVLEKNQIFRDEWLGI